MDNLGKIAHDAFTNLFLRRLDWNSLRPSAQRLWHSGAAAVLGHDRRSSFGQMFHDGMMEDTGLPVNHLPKWTDCGISLQSQYEHAAAAVLRAAPARIQAKGTKLPAALLSPNVEEITSVAN